MSSAQQKQLDFNGLTTRLSERNFENALDKLENLDQVVDPPKEPSHGHHGGPGHEGGPPVKREEADQGYEGYTSKSRSMQHQAVGLPCTDVDAFRTKL